jgi:hypothetical protein
MGLWWQLDLGISCVHMLLLKVMRFGSKECAAQVLLEVKQNHVVRMLLLKLLLFVHCCCCAGAA